MKYLSVCSGMEAASVAWHSLGWTPVGFSEIEPFPAAILKHRFPNTPNYGDLTKYKEWPIEPGTVDVLVGGTPCQSFSVAGLRKGMADPRGNLALVFLGLADHLRPRWIVWENVPGVLSANGGNDFASFLSALAELGYGACWRVLDARHFGVAQRRRRVFVVAHLGDWRPAAAVLFESESLRGDPSTGRKARKGSASDAEESTGGDGDEGAAGDSDQRGAGLGGVAFGGANTSGPIQVSTTLLGHSSVRGDFESETFVQQPVVIDRAAFNQGANAQFVPNIQESETMDTLVARGPHAVGVPYRKSKRAQSAEDNETWVQDEASNTLNNFDLGDTRTTHAVVEPGQVIPTLTNKMQGQSGWAPYNETAHILPVLHCADVAPTVTSSGPPYSRTGNERVEADALAVTAIPIQDGRAIEKHQGGMGVGKPGDPAYTLDTTGAQGVGIQAFYSNESRADLPPPDIAPTIKVGSSGTCGNPPAVCVPQAFSFDSLASNSMKSSNPISGCRPVDCAKTLDTTNPIPTKNQGGIAIVHPQAFAVREDSSNNTFHAKPVDTALCVNALQPSPQSQHAQNFVVDQKPICFKIRGGSPTETGEQGGTPGKGAGKGYLGVEDQTFTIATSQDQWLAQPIIAPTVTTCKGSKGGSSSEAIDEIIAVHEAQHQAIPLDSMNLLSRLGPACDDHSLQNFVPGDPMFTLTKAQHHAVAQPVFAFQQSELRRAGTITNQELSPTLMANSKSGDNELNVVQPIACQPGFLSRGEGPRPSTDSFPTLTKNSGDQSPHVCAPTITASNDPSRSPQSSEVTAQVSSVHQVTMAVRRLTPVECERLQGFPDNWSRIPWKGKPEEECPDGPRYKACGNSMAVPVMHFIGSRIQLVSDVLKEAQAKA